MVMHKRLRPVFTSLLLAALCAAPALHAQEYEPVDGGVTEPLANVVPDVLPEPAPVAPTSQGVASWYGPGFHGRKTASGERFDMNALTAAHRTLPFGTLVRVRSLINGLTVDVRINDRGPFLKRRVIDLSKAAAKALGLLAAGTGTKPVELFVVEQPGAVFR
ncbi:MAG: septal ring lytic transglycosylase RlpA family protein [Ramlibacter sp.]